MVGLIGSGSVGRTTAAFARGPAPVGADGASAHAANVEIQPISATVRARARRWRDMVDSGRRVRNARLVLSSQQRGHTASLLTHSRYGATATRNCGCSTFTGTLLFAMDWLPSWPE